MVLFDRDGQPLVSYSTAGINHPDHRRLQQCALDNLAALVSLASAVELFCSGEQGRPFLGVMTQVSDNASRVPGEGALVMFEPMVDPSQGPRLRQQMQALAAQMVSAASHEAITLPSLIRLRGSDGRLIGLHNQSSLPSLLESLRDDLLVLLALLAPLLLIRMQLTLAHRRQRLGTLHRERRAAERIRRVCQQLDGLLGQAGVQSERLSTQQRVMDRLVSPEPLVREPRGHPLALERRFDSFARRFQHFLDGAHSLALLDQLTQLPNRRFFLEQLALEVQRHQQEQQPIAPAVRRYRPLQGNQ